MTVCSKEGLLLPSPLITLAAAGSRRPVSRTDLSSARMESPLVIPFFPPLLMFGYGRQSVSLDGPSCFLDQSMSWDRICSAFCPHQLVPGCHRLHSIGPSISLFERRCLSTIPLLPMRAEFGAALYKAFPFLSRATVLLGGPFRVCLLLAVILSADCLLVSPPATHVPHYSMSFYPRRVACLRIQLILELSRPSCCSITSSAP